MAEHIFKAPTDEWCTSPVIWRPLVEHFGGIGLDPCSNHRSGVPARVRVMYNVPTWAQPMIAAQFADEGVIVIFGDGLVVPWGGYGLVYVNPPFKTIGPWAELLANGEGDEAVLLIPSRTGADYYQQAIQQTWVARCWISRNGDGGRIYETALGVPAPYSPPWHSVLHYWGERPEVFERAYQHLGEVEIR